VLGKNTASIRLDKSEAEVMRAAAQIYSAYILAGQVAPGTEHQWLEKCLDDAIHLARRAEAKIQSDGELG